MGREDGTWMGRIYYTPECCFPRVGVVSCVSVFSSLNCELELKETEDL